MNEPSQPLSQSVSQLVGESSGFQLKPDALRPSSVVTGHKASKQPEKYALDSTTQSVFIVCSVLCSALVFANQKSVTASPHSPAAAARINLPVTLVLVVVVVVVDGVETQIIEHSAEFTTFLNGWMDGSGRCEHGSARPPTLHAWSS